MTGVPVKDVYTSKGDFLSMIDFCRKAVKIEQGVVSFNAALSACGNASEWQLGSAVYL